MKRFAYLLGIAFLAVSFAGLWWFGMQLPLGFNPHSLADLGRMEVDVDSFVTKRMHGIREILYFGQPEWANVNIVIRTTDDQEKCRITYPKDLIKVTRVGGMLRCTVTKEGAALDTNEKHKLVHKYSDEDLRILRGWDEEHPLYSLDDEREMQEDIGGNLFVYITVMNSLWAIEIDDNCSVYFIDAKLKSLGCYNNGNVRFYGNTQIDYLYSSWYGFDLGRAHIKKMEVEANGYVSFGDSRCRVDSMLFTGKGNIEELTFASYGKIKVKEKAYGDLTYGEDSIPLAKVIRNKYK